MSKVPYNITKCSLSTRYKQTEFLLQPWSLSTLISTRDQSDISTLEWKGQSTYLATAGKVLVIRLIFYAASTHPSKYKQNENDSNTHGCSLKTPMTRGTEKHNWRKYWYNFQKVKNVWQIIRKHWDDWTQEFCLKSCLTSDQLLNMPLLPLGWSLCHKEGSKRTLLLHLHHFQP